MKWIVITSPDFLSGEAFFIDKIFDMTKFWDDFNTTLTFKI